jgi:hypothetical protein
MRPYHDTVLSHAASLGSPGVDKLNWLSPVSPVDRLSGLVQVTSVRPSHSQPHYGLVRIGGKPRDAAGGAKPRMTAWGFFGRRPDPAPAEVGPGQLIRELRGPARPAARPLGAAPGLGRPPALPESR